MAHEVAQLSMEVGLLTKQFSMINFEKVNTVGTQGRASRSYDSDIDKARKYLNKELEGFRAKGQGSN